MEPGAYTVCVVYAVERDGLVEEPEVLFETRVVVGDEAQPLQPEGGEEPFPVLATDVNLTKADDGGTAELPGIGGQLVVVLEGNPSTGFNWLVEVVDESILRRVGDPDFLADDPRLVGSGGKVALRFEGVGAGQTALRLVYRRPWENDVAPLEIFEVTVTVLPGEVDRDALQRADYDLTEADNGEIVAVEQVGEVVQVTLEGNPSTGYLWEVDAVDETILQPVGEPEFRASSDRVGAGGLRILRFQAVAAGRTVMRLVYRRPWESDVEPLETFEVQIDVR